MQLLDQYLDKYVDVVEVFMHDYMHALWVDIQLVAVFALRSVLPAETASVQDI